jgi:hypothetical protein
LTAFAVVDLAYIGPSSSGATGQDEKSSGELGTGALFDEVPPVAHPELLFVCLPVALGSLGSLLLQLLTSFLIPDFLDLGPLFRCHSPPDPALLGRFLFLRGLALALPFRHASAHELSQISPEDVLMPCLPETFLLVLFAQHPPVRPGQVGLRNSRIAGNDEQCKRQPNKDHQVAHC